jgi:uncharacterized protein YmfQ (DUF2313 family)
LILAKGRSFMSSCDYALSYESFHIRHSESAMQALIEDWERHKGLPHPTDMSLAARWARLVQNDDKPRRVA